MKRVLKPQVDTFARIIEPEKSSLRTELEQTFKLLWPWFPESFYGKHSMALSIGFIFFALMSLTILGWVTGGFSAKPNRISYVDNFVVGQVPTVLILGVGIYFYFANRKAMLDMFEGLQKNNLFRSNKIRIDLNTHNFADKFLVSWVPLTTFVSVVIIWMLWSYSPFSPPYWYRDNFGVTLLATIIMGIAWFPIGALLRDVQIVIIILYRILRDNEVDVYALHPDGAGGFGPIGTYTVQIVTKVAVPFGITLIVFALNSFFAGRLQIDYPLFGMLSAYVIILPSMSYLLIRSSHIKMSAYKYQISLQVAALYKDKYLEKSSSNSSLEFFEDKTKNLALLKKMHKFAEAYPEWPFNTSMLVRFASSVLLPLLPTVIGLIIQK